MNLRFQGLQQLGRALMLPIAVLPIAGLLLRIGQPDVLNWPAMAAAGDAIFSNLGLLFAVGVAVGLAKENHGAAGLAALVCYLVTTHGVETMMVMPDSQKAQEISKMSVPVGLLCGIIAGVAYNRLGNINLPSYLSFFGGRRFVAIATGLAGLALAAVIGTFWPSVEHGMDSVSHGIVGAGSIGLFVYGVLNRILIVTGLHHILNNFAWFIVGDYHGATGDLKRFFAGDPSAGAFMSGFFPVMMFGLPGACLAMYRAARPERRKAVGGLFISLALTSFLTGVTEPVEFTFMFLAPVLYALHAVATGLAMALMDWLHIRLGFSFSAGLFDYLLNFSHAQRPLWLLPIGALYFGLYYGLFRYFIVRFNLATPGREAEDAVADAAGVPPLGDASPVLGAASRSVARRAEDFIAALGGRANLKEVEACTTRLRIVLNNDGSVDEGALRRLGSRGTVRPGSNSLQVVLGPVADQVASEIRAALRAPSPAANAVSSAPGATPRLLDLLGGRANILEVMAVPGRLLLKVARPASVDDQGLLVQGVRAVARPAPDSVHLLLSGSAEDAVRLKAILTAA